MAKWAEKKPVATQPAPIVTSPEPSPIAAAAPAVEHDVHSFALAVMGAKHEPTEGLSCGNVPGARRTRPAGFHWR